MSSTDSQVVVGFDFSHSGRSALYRGLAVAKRAPFHVLHFIYVLEPHSTYTEAERKQRAVTDEIEQELRESGAGARIHFYVHVRIGHPADEILALAREVGADLIIVGSKGLTGVERFVLGSVSEKVVREAGCTVEVARGKRYEHVDLADVREVEPHGHYVPPHRYYYEENRLLLRPTDWPLP